MPLLRVSHSIFAFDFLKSAQDIIFDILVTTSASVDFLSFIVVIDIADQFRVCEYRLILFAFNIIRSTRVKLAGVMLGFIF